MNTTMLEKSLNDRIQIKLHKNHVRSMLHTLLDVGASEMMLYIDEYGAVSYEFNEGSKEFTKDDTTGTIFKSFA